MGYSGYLHRRLNFGVGNPPPKKPCKYCGVEGYFKQVKQNGETRWKFFESVSGELHRCEKWNPSTKAND